MFITLTPCVSRHAVVAHIAFPTGKVSFYAILWQFSKLENVGEGRRQQLLIHEASSFSSYVADAAWKKWKEEGEEGWTFFHVPEKEEEEEEAAAKEEEAVEGGFKYQSLQGTWLGQKIHPVFRKILQLLSSQKKLRVPFTH